MFILLALWLFHFLLLEGLKLRYHLEDPLLIHGSDLEVIQSEYLLDLPLLISCPLGYQAVSIHCELNGTLLVLNLTLDILYPGHL